MRSLRSQSRPYRPRSDEGFADLCSDQKRAISGVTLLNPIRLAEHFDEVTEYWSPNVVCRVNDQYMKVAKVKDRWHGTSTRPRTNCFWVLRGRLTIELDRGRVALEPGDCYVVPRGVRHNPVAEEECWIVLIETVSTPATSSFRRRGQ